jgi:hypothetical protein
MDMEVNPRDIVDEEMVKAAIEKVLSDWTAKGSGDVRELAMRAAAVGAGMSWAKGFCAGGRDAMKSVEILTNLKKKKPSGE